MILITGASGFLGRQVFKQFPDAIGTCFSRPGERLIPLDLTDFNAVADLLDKHKFTTIIHCAAERRPDVAAKDPSQALKLNVECTKNLATEAKKRGIYLIYISTDYVFDGNSPPYKEDDTPNPINFYGQSKQQGEVQVLQHCDTAMIMRVPVLYGPTVPGKHSESAVNILIDIVKDNSKKVVMDDFQSRFPTNILDIAKVLKQVVERKGKLRGIYHFSARERMTKYEMCKVFGDILKLGIDHITPNQNAPTDPVATRPNDCQLLTDKLEQAGIDISCVDFKAWFTEYLKDNDA